MLSRNKIRLSRSLHAQTTPYPEAGQWIKRGIFVLLFILVAGIYFFARPQMQKPPEFPKNAEPKQILGEQKVQADYQTYEIKKGDTLFNLSNQFNVSWQTLAEINNLEEPYILKIGQKIKIPK